MIVLIVWFIHFSTAMFLLWKAIGKDALANFKTEPFFSAFYFGGSAAIIGAFTAALTCTVFS